LIARRSDYQIDRKKQSEDNLDNSAHLVYALLERLATRIETENPRLIITLLYYCGV